MGTYDVDTGQFVPTDDPSLVNSVKVPLVESDIGLGLGEAFFGKTWSVTACSAVMAGTGNANTGTIGGPGLANGHFDYDSTDARVNCAGGSECDGTAKHTHEFDDDWDVTWADQFSDLGGHLPVDGCTSITVDKKGKLKTSIDPDCTDAGSTRTIPDAQTFKIIVANADLSPGAWITINGVDHDVVEYDDTAFADLPTYSLGGGGTLLGDFQVNFDVEAIANCELIPTNTGDMKSNTPGIDGEWRSGALTVQFVSTTAVSSGGRSAGGHDVVISEDAGLLYEATYFWHWDGPSYTVADAYAWQTAYDLLDCGKPIFIDQTAGGAVCN